MRTTYTYTPPLWILAAIAWSAVGVLAFFSVLNVQPWMSAAKWLAGPTPDIPLIGLLYEVRWGVGAVARWLAANVVSLGGIVIWAIVQGIEIASMWVKRPESLRRMETQAASYLEGKTGKELEAAKHAVARLAKRLDEALTAEVEFFERARIFAYAGELIVCLFHFPVYEDGSAALWSDLVNMELFVDALQPREIAMVVIMMGGFEALFRITLALWGIYKSGGER